ncbi:MAG: glycerophosphodiester phosphodiesterase family protein [Sphingomonadaceae bacterium]
MTRILSCALAALIATSALSPAVAAEAQTAGVTSAQIAKAARGRIPAFVACLGKEGVSVVGGHRGGPSAGYPENALATYKRSVAAAPMWVEGDIQITKDGVLVLNHDTTLDRTSTGKGEIRNHTWAELQSVRLKDPQGSVTEHGLVKFADWLAWADGKAILQVDTKPATGDDKVVAAVKAAKAEDRVVYVTYTIDQARNVMRLSPGAVVSVPVRNRQDLEAAKAAGVFGPQVVAMVLPVAGDPDFYRDVAATGSPMVDLGIMWGEEAPDKRYKGLADASLYQTRQIHSQIVPSDHPLQAVEALSADPGYRAKLAACGVR